MILNLGVVEFGRSPDLEVPKTRFIIREYCLSFSIND